jgi:Crp-like helix-turn-helix domain
VPESTRPWAEAVGQSLYYAAATNRKPGIILLCEQSEGPVEGLCRSYVYRLEYALKFVNTHVYVWTCAIDKDQAELLRLASLVEGKSARIVPAPTHVEIASRVSTQREAVTRELNRLSRIGIIERRGGTLLVKDTDRLSEMVHDATGE